MVPSQLPRNMMVHYTTTTHLRPSTSRAHNYTLLHVINEYTLSVWVHGYRKRKMYFGGIYMSIDINLWLTEFQCLHQTYGSAITENHIEGPLVVNQ